MPGPQPGSCERSERGSLTIRGGLSAVLLHHVIQPLQGYSQQKLQGVLEGELPPPVRLGSNQPTQQKYFSPDALTRTKNTDAFAEAHIGETREPQMHLLR